MKRPVTVVVDQRSFTVVLSSVGKAYFPNPQGGPGVPCDHTLPDVLVRAIEQKVSDTIKEGYLSNALVRQKDSILQDITDGNLLKVVRKLAFAWPVWDASDYSYKTDEIINRINLACADLARTSEDQLYISDVLLELRAIIDDRAACYA